MHQHPPARRHAPLDEGARVAEEAKHGLLLLVAPVVEDGQALEEHIVRKGAALVDLDRDVQDMAERVHLGRTSSVLVANPQQRQDLRRRHRQSSIPSLPLRHSHKEPGEVYNVNNSSCRVHFSRYPPEYIQGMT
jgi:hypothetical protein